MIAKAGLGLIGLSAISIGGVAVTKPYWLGMDYMPEWHSLSKDSDYTSAYSDTNHFGKKYGKYLVGVTNETNGKDKNQSFWEWAFRQMSKEIEKSKFSTKKPNAKIDKGFSDADNDTALNQVCKAAYKTQESGFHNETTGNENGDKFNKGDVWKYCSPIGQKPTTVKEYDRKDEDSNKKYESGDKIGKKQETSLISVFDKGNDIFWNMRDKEIKDKSLSVEESHNFFKKAEDKNTHIKDLCKDAYEKSSTVSGGETPYPSDTETKKYCSLEATA